MASSHQKLRRLAAPLLFVMLTLPVAATLAVRPAVTLWLEFEYDTPEQPELEGMQILQCETPECSRPTLLHGYGKCDSQGCVDGEPALEAAQPLECWADRCVAVLLYANEAVPPLKIVGQFSDRVRESDLYSDELPQYGTLNWKITVHDTVLAVAVSDKPQEDSMGIYSGNFEQYFGLTLIVELLIAAVALRGWLKTKARSLVSGLGYVLLANLISYPATWIFWPSLQAFQPMETRYVGYLVVALTLVFAGLILIVSRQKGKARLVWLIATLFLLPPAVYVTGLCLFLDIWGVGHLIAVPGLPAGVTIALAEVFAVSFEALLLYLLARKTVELTFRQAAVLSIMANMSSFLIGLLVTGWL